MARCALDAARVSKVLMRTQHPRRLSVLSKNYGIASASGVKIAETSLEELNTTKKQVAVFVPSISMSLAEKKEDTPDLVR
jgi:hypothetical protein